MTGAAAAAGQASAIEIADVANARDVGGVPTVDGGAVRTGLAYRSADLNGLQPAGAADLVRLGIVSVYDLRTDQERNVWPERDGLPPTVRYAIADVLADSPDENPASFRDAILDPEAMERLFGEGRATAMFERRYREFVHLPSGRIAYGRLLAGLARPDGRPALFHCTTGKDRTGWAAAVLQLFLGVPVPLVMAAYLANTAQGQPSMDRVVRTFVAGGGDPAVIEPLMRAQPRYLEAALDEMTGRYGSVEGYVADGLGLDVEARRALRGAFVTDGD